MNAKINPERLLDQSERESFGEIEDGNDQELLVQRHVFTRYVRTWKRTPGHGPTNHTGKELKEKRKSRVFQGTSKKS